MDHVEGMRDKGLRKQLSSTELQESKVGPKKDTLVGHLKKGQALFISNNITRVIRRLFL